MQQQLKIIVMYVYITHLPLRGLKLTLTVNDVMRFIQLYHCTLHLNSILYIVQYVATGIQFLCEDLEWSVFSNLSQLFTSVEANKLKLSTLHVQVQTFNFAQWKFLFQYIVYHMYMYK